MRFTHDGQKWLITDDKNAGYRITDQGHYVLDTFAAFRARRKQDEAVQDSCERLAAWHDENAGRGEGWL